MAMPLGFASRVSLYSMRKRIIRTTLSLLPCVLLIAIMFVGSTIPNGLVNEIDAKVLSVAQERQEFLMLDSYMFAKQDFSFTPAGGPSQPEFDQDRFKLATESPYVEKVYPQRGAVSGTAVQIGNVPKPSVSLSGVSAEFAKLYSPEEFQYIEGQPIPVLINPTNIYGVEYAWNGQSTLELDYADTKDLESRQKYYSLGEPEKLIGTTFRAEFGAFPGFPEAFDEQSFGSSFGPPKSKLIKLTDQDRDILQRRVKEIYGPYWDVQKLSVPTTFEFKIVGLLQSNSMGSSGQVYAPNDAIPAIWNAMYSKQIGARTAKALDKEFLSTEQSKIEVSDGYIPDTSAFFYTSPSWMKDESVSAWEVDISQIRVPALLVEPAKNARGQNEYRVFGASSIDSTNFQQSGAIVKLKSSEDRDEYVKFLNDNGFYYFDNSPVAMIKGIRKGANVFVTWLTIILGTVVAFILLITMSRFVADSRKEIGVWRAIGATRLDIIQLVLVRMGLLLLIGIGFGVAIGYGISAVLASAIVNSVNEVAGAINPYGFGGGNFLGQIILSFLGGQVPELEITKLLAPNWQLLASRLGLLAFITMLVGLIPALRAARISPVTAIRDSE